MPEKKSPTDHLPVPVQLIERRIYLIRAEKVMLDSDLAELYQVPTKSLNLAVRRNAERFPEDFMFQLTKEEYENLRFQFETSSSGYGGRRYLPYAFTEQGVAMLSSVLNSQRAVQVNILIIRVFVRLRELLATHKDLARKIEQLQAAQEDHAVLIALVSKDVQTLAKNVAKEFRRLKNPRRRRLRIGFHVPDEK
ncbi:MAG: DNA-binding protein [Terriglobia bacterium]|nr:MAG: DNA-binding protein [Terriglobia bacterium]